MQREDLGTSIDTGVAWAAIALCYCFYSRVVAYPKMRTHSPMLSAFLPEKTQGTHNS